MLYFVVRLIFVVGIIIVFLLLNLKDKKRNKDKTIIFSKRTIISFLLIFYKSRLAHST